MQLVHHTDRVFSIPSFLERDKCSKLVALSESCGFNIAGVRTSEGQKAMPNVRNNERTIFEDPAWVNFLWTRLASASLPAIQGKSPIV